MALPLYYNVRNLFVRKLSSLLTFVVVAAVVFVLAVLLSFAAGIHSSLAVSGNERNLIVLAKGSTSESTSIVFPDEAAQLVQTPGLALDSDGTQLLSREISMQTSIPRLSKEANLANVAIRAVDDVAFRVHSGLRLIEGRRFEQGKPEIIAGKQAALRYKGLKIGDRLPLGRLGNREFEVVGIFDAEGSALESEIWGPRTIVGDVFGRTILSNVLLRLSPGFPADQAIAYINGASVSLQAKKETDYYAELGSKTREIVVIATILVAIMAVGAVFAVANTMYAAVDNRRREIAMLRTLGFGRRAVLRAFTTESLLICLPASLFGLAASLLLNGVRQDYLSDATFTVLAYDLRITPGIVVVSLSLAIAVGLVGALAPAVKAARTRIIEALRKT